MTTATQFFLIFIILLFITSMIYYISYTFTWNTTDYQEIIEYYTIQNLDDKDVNLISHESLSAISSWQQLNEQQFCQIENSSIDQLKFMQYLYNLQYDINCSDSSTKFLVYDIALSQKNGLGATISGDLKRYLTIAMMLNRTFLINGKFDWSHNVSYCQNANAMECYFIPPSKCNPIHILSNTNKSNSNLYHQGQAPKNCIFGSNNKFNNLSHCEYRVIYINKASGRPLKRRPLHKYISSNFNNMQPITHNAMIAAFFLRVQPNIKAIVNDKITKSIDKSLNGNLSKLDASKTISLPIRGSDKCNNIHDITNKQYTHHAEITCFTPMEYLGIMNAVKYLTQQKNESINSVILTSEDSTFIQNVITLMKDKRISNVSNWNIIENHEDYSIGEGTTTYKDTKERFKTNITLFHGTSLETDHIVSAISSLILQIHLESKYLVFLEQSSWTATMRQLSATMNCNMNKSKHERNKKSQCIQLITPGYLKQYIKQKYVRFSPDLWKIIQKLKLEPQLFFDKFGVEITDDGYQHHC